MVETARQITSKPILAKVSPNWTNTTRVAADAVEAGADGTTAIDSLGPVLSIDIHTASPNVAGESGMGWLTGAPIKTLALRHVAEISAALGPEVPIIGTGGVTQASDGVEMLMAGASHIGICTLPILKGLDAIPRFIDQLTELVTALGYESIDDIRGRATAALFGPEDTGPHRLVFLNAPCKSCRLCVSRCPYRALTLDDGHISIDHDRCHRCGLCVPSCRHGNLTLERVAP
jgi:dihydroorotate dehydrogenase (fumarate)